MWCILLNPDCEWRNWNNCSYKREICTIRLQIQTFHPYLLAQHDLLSNLKHFSLFDRISDDSTAIELIKLIVSSLNYYSINDSDIVDNKNASLFSRNLLENILTSTKDIVNFFILIIFLKNLLFRLLENGVHDFWTHFSHSIIMAIFGILTGIGLFNSYFASYQILQRKLWWRQ
jgi:hypothetical protein